MPQRRTRQAKALIRRALPKDEILQRIAEGQTLDQISAELEPIVGQRLSRYYLHKALVEFGEEYEQAKRLAAAYHADRVRMVTDLVEGAQMDPQTARIASDNHKWLATKGDPAAFGDRTQVDLNVVDLGKLHLAALRERMKTVRAVMADRQKAALRNLGADALSLPAPVMKDAERG